MITIYLEDGFPLLFTQNRTGWDGRRFKIYKLRTLRKEKFDKTIQGYSALYERYMDDIICSAKSDDIDVRLDMVNNLHPNLHFTFEKENASEKKRKKIYMTETEIQKLIDKRKTEMTDADDLVDEEADLELKTERFNKIKDIFKKISHDFFIGVVSSHVHANIFLFIYRANCLNRAKLRSRNV